MRYKITLSYDGTGFCGWQSQPNGMSVQDETERAVFKLFGERSRVTGSGRTDAGVHALGQVAHFDAQKALPMKNVVGGLNAYLPREIRVLGAEEAAADFDACRGAHRKTYMYLMYLGETLPPVLNDRAVCVGADIDVSAMTAAARGVLGTHDFSTFMAAGSGARTFTRTVFGSELVQSGRFLKYFVTADGFLYNMVRIITAQLIKAGRGGDVDMPFLIAQKDRSFAKELAPACGLYLYGVDYGMDDE